MTRTVWKLESHLARLKIDRLSAKLDLRRPDVGLFGLSSDHGRSLDASLLALQVPAFSEGHELPPAECYARQTDLFASYSASATWPVHVNALWRVPSAMPSKSPALAVELVVSVRTDQLASRPELTVQSRLAADEVVRLSDADSATFEALQLVKGEPIDLRPDGGTGCLLFRLEGGDLTYAEMIHPADFRSDRLDRDPKDDRFVRIGHTLFCEPLEKGVIRRSGISGVFLPRTADKVLAAAHFSLMAASEPFIAT